jgi:hypothetical protein
MTAEQFKTKFSHKTTLIDKYGLVYFVVNDVININNAEELATKHGFEVERQTDDYTTRYFLWSKIFFEGKLVGHIDLQGFPSMEFLKSKRKIVTNSKIAEDAMVIKPIEGIHRILDWHTVKSKMHCLAGGQTVLHLMPVELTEELMQEWITKLQLQPLVDKTKKI